MPEPAARKKVWASLGGMGIVLDDGEAVALWRPRKQGKRLDVTVEALAEVDREAVEHAVERLAPHRGCETVRLRFA